MNKTKESILADLEKFFISGADSTNEKWFPPAIIEFVSQSLEEYADWKIKENDANWQAVIGYNCDKDTLQRIALAIKILSNKDKK